MTNIPLPQDTVFRNYLSNAGSLQETLSLSKAEYEGFSKLSTHDKNESTSEEDGDQYKRIKEQNNGASLASDKHPESPRPKQREDFDNRPSSSRLNRGHRLSRTALNTVPNVYFEDPFHLEDPRTFDVVSEWAEVAPRSEWLNGNAENGPENSVVTKSGGRKALSTNAIIQEKLSWYMDTVEIHLISSISSASTSFFSALGSLRLLQRETKESIDKIKVIREELTDLKGKVACGGLNVAKIQRRRLNLQKLLSATQQISGISDGILQCNRLVDEDNLEHALLLSTELQLKTSLDSYKSQATTNQPHDDYRENIADIKGTKMLERLQRNIEEVRYRIGKGYENKFQDLLMDDMRKHLKTMSTNEILQRWDIQSQRNRGEQPRSQSIVPSYFQIQDNFRSKMLQNVKGLYKTGMATSAIAALRELVIREMKMSIRRNLPSSNDDDMESVTSVSTRSGRRTTQQERSAILARNLRALDPEAAEELLAQSYTSVGESLRRLGVQLKVLLDVISGIGDDEFTRTEGPASEPKPYRSDSKDIHSTGPDHVDDLQQAIMQALDMSGLLGQAIDAAQAQITKVLKVRAEQWTHLPFQQFLRYVTINRLFADECEAISGKSGESFKSVVNSHIVQFVTALGDQEKQKLAQAMELDKWEPYVVTTIELACLSRIIEAAHADASSWMQSTRIWENVAETEADNEQTLSETGEKDKSKHLNIDDQSFIVVKAIGTVLISLDTFENLLAVVPNLAHEVCFALADYLRLFNSRTYQLILGAGATKSAGLKNINTKHLALALQSLSFITTLIPYIKNCVTRHRSSSVLLTNELDKVKLLYDEHQVSIQNKLTDIMESRSATHVNDMQKVDWDADAERTVSQYMETLTKETTTLYRVLNRNLPEMTAREIMDSVFSKYREHWGRAFQNAQFKTEVGKSRSAINLFEVYWSC